MRLIKARFDGFRLLDGAEFNFSVDKKKNVTVIRAANESGKTTLLSALQWALFGDEALPSTYTTISMDIPEGMVGTTTAEVTYEVETPKGTRRYRLVRSLSDRAGSSSRPKSSVALEEIKPTGNDSVPNVESYLGQHMPADLREVFFTDGDRALSFIEGRRGDQQKRVRRAIEQLMGLPLLEAALEHVKKAERDIRAKADNVSGSQQLSDVRAQLEALDLAIPDNEAKLAATTEEIANLSDLYSRADRTLQDALKKGNREEIAGDLQRIEKQRAASEARKRTADLDQSRLLSGIDFAKGMMGEKLKAAGKVLDQLRKKGQIPNSTIPVLEERLTHADCICGESLDPNDRDGARRRAHILHLIEDSRATDVLKSRISTIYYESRELTNGKMAWHDQYVKAYSARTREQETYEELGRQAAELEARLSKIKDNDVQSAREMRDTYLQQLTSKREQATRLDVTVRNLRQQRGERAKEMETLLARETKGRKFAAELSAAGDLRKIVEQTLVTMKTREVDAVSRHMNELFLQMIGADPDRAMIRRAAITTDFNIIVYGRNERLLDPSQDLNGASRRALTIAFILALTQVSGVEAPNVIDTPLGMMTGFVKREVVKVAASSSSQLILLLTPDEINGCEDILDQVAGEVVTMTNPAHYPVMLKHDPGTSDARVLICKCDHVSSCEICERNTPSTPKQVGEAA
ncbi:DNA sulfur modification protein DndD [Mesorhizobium sp. NFR06]|uniref:AAA family ATPase n=1 Tax=Mesorhizobium sp. NFR06 TaxID=1566290 RepID=UPI0008EC9D13|nr:AAA family ATPase [Mesorhizobium sp. NFR06]SFO57959.1 DNA sulfur modification protein DndD [Mesorhizobium sp. NFR06]